MIHLMILAAVAIAWYPQPSSGMSATQSASGESSVVVPVIVVPTSTVPTSARRPMSEAQWVAGATAAAAIVWLFLRRMGRRPVSVGLSENRRPAGPSESDFDWLKEHDSRP